MFLLTPFTAGDTVMQRKSSCRQHTTCQLADLFFSVHSGYGYLTMFRAYFDESGHPDDPNSPVVSVAAVAADIDQWHAFDEQWNDILKVHGVRGLHMTDYESRQGEYRHWKRGDQQTIQFISDLASALINTIQYGCVCSFAMDDWNDIMRDRFEIPYERKRASLIVLLQICLEELNRTNLLPKDQQIHCVYEENDFLARAPNHFIDWKKAWGLEERFGGFGFDDKYNLPGLQAADMLAYEGRKHYLNQEVLRNGIPERKLHKRLRESDKIAFSIADKQTFNSYLEAYHQHFELYKEKQS